MGRHSKSGALDLWMNGELVGHWTADSRHHYELRYSPRWLEANARRPISLSLPLSEQPYRGDRVYSFFDNLLPDSQSIRRRVAARYALDSTEPFELLEEIGRDCVGALQLLPAGSPPPDPKRIEGRELNEAQIELYLEGVVSSPGVFGQASYLRDFRISLAGAQEKTAFLLHGDRWQEPLGATPTTHIFKLPMGVHHGLDLSTSIENEWLCHKLLQGYRIPVAACEMRRFGAAKVLVVERFDRRLSADGSWLMRLPQEDFCQATGTPGVRKYENAGGPGIKRILETLLTSREAAADRLDFFRTQVVFWLLCAIDGHAKNFSIFLEAGGRFRLTPRYDVLSAYPVLGSRLSPHEVKMAMAVAGKNRHYEWKQIERRHWEATARSCGLPPPGELLDELAALTPAVVAGIELPPGFPDAVATPVLEGLAAAAGRL